MGISCLIAPAKRCANTSSNCIARLGFYCKVPSESREPMDDDISIRQRLSIYGVRPDTPPNEGLFRV